MTGTETQHLTTPATSPLATAVTRGPALGLPVRPPRLTSSHPIRAGCLLFTCLPQTTLHNLCWPLVAFPRVSAGCGSVPRTASCGVAVHLFCVPPFSHAFLCMLVSWTFCNSGLSAPCDATSVAFPLSQELSILIVS